MPTLLDLPLDVFRIWLITVVPCTAALFAINWFEERALRRHLQEQRRLDRDLLALAQAVGVIR